MEVKCNIQKEASWIFLESSLNLFQSSQVDQGSRIHILKIHILHIIERSKYWKFQLSYPFCLDFMAFWIFHGMLNFSVYRDFLNFGKQLSEILKFYKALEDIPLNICSGYYRKQFRT